MSELVWGIKNGDLDQVKDIVEKKSINLNEQIDGRPPILYAADYGQKDVIEYLISAGANVNVSVDIILLDFTINAGCICNLLVLLC
ncbi:hypothetical protein WA026_016821 [Henosepilachna vigintioctopunctata]|uniref:Myotrophin n=1 Tax=Henosepilachna vigintioctopunctata TaxID=420089 RepID=A0AAW1V385_9CUCU